MILTYHLVFPDSHPKDCWSAGNVIRIRDFARQMRYLKKHYQILPLEAYVEVFFSNSSQLNRTIALTFDDCGHRIFSLVEPVLSQERLPATFFANTSHLKDGKLLWFTYFNALCFEKAYSSININGREYPLRTKQQCFQAWQDLIHQAQTSGDAISYSEAISAKYPLPREITQNYLGLTEEQIKRIGSSAQFTLGGHTHHHPYLTQLSSKEQQEEIIENKRLLEQIGGKPVRCFAYPGGKYTREVIDIVKVCGFSAACAESPLNLGEPRFELPRTGIYSPSMAKFILKLKGFNRSTLFMNWKRDS